MSTVAGVMDQYQPVVDRFLQAIRIDFRIAEAMAQRGSAIHANHKSSQLAGSTLSGE